MMQVQGMRLCLGVDIQGVKDEMKGMGRMM